MLNVNQINSILIIGFAGGLAQALTNLLLKTYPNIKVTGIDSRDLSKFEETDNLKLFRIKYSRSNFEKIFRGHKFDVVYHLGRLSHAYPKANVLERADINVVGTQRIMELSLRFGVKKVVVLSTYHVYGAFPDNPIFLPETAPLRASFKYPELHDVVEMDQGTAGFMWRYHDQIETVIFRPCNIIGHNIRNVMCSYLMTPYAIVPSDFKPMFQFIHESDMTRILLRSLENVPGGVYNVAPRDTISMPKAKKLLGGEYFKAPISLVQPLARFVRWPGRLPQYLFDYLKYSCVVSTEELDKHLGPRFCHYSTREAVAKLLDETAHG